jgi:hypothetical protein
MYLARLGTETLRNGNELECSGFTITPSPLKQKFLRSPTGVTPSRSGSTTGGRIPQNKEYQENTVKYYIYIVI